MSDETPELIAPEEEGEPPVRAEEGPGFFFLLAMRLPMGLLDFHASEGRWCWVVEAQVVK